MALKRLDRKNLQFGERVPERPREPTTTKWKPRGQCSDNFRRHNIHGVIVTRITRSPEPECAKLPADRDRELELSARNPFLSAYYTPASAPPSSQLCVETIYYVNLDTFQLGKINTRTECVHVRKSFSSVHTPTLKSDFLCGARETLSPRTSVSYSHLSARCIFNRQTHGISATISIPSSRHHYSFINRHRRSVSVRRIFIRI